jgi:hypothetical protein
MAASVSHIGWRFVAFYSRVLVIVIGQGTIAEFDTPLNLYDREDSIFRSLCGAAYLDREAILKIRNEEPGTMRSSA